MNGVKPGAHCALYRHENAIGIFKTPDPASELKGETCRQDWAKQTPVLLPPAAGENGALGLSPENVQPAEEEVGEGPGAAAGDTGAATGVCY